MEIPFLTIYIKAQTNSNTVDDQKIKFGIQNIKAMNALLLIYKLSASPSASAAP